MATSLASALVVPATNVNCECLKGPPPCELPVSRFRLTATSSSGVNGALARKQSPSSRRRNVHASRHRQFLLQAVGDLRCEEPEPERQLSTKEESPEERREQAVELLRREEIHPSPFSPAGGRQYEEPELPTFDDDEITVQDAPFNSLHENYAARSGNHSEAAFDQGANVFSQSPEDLQNLSRVESSEALVNRLLEFLPIYHLRKSKESYRIRAIVYGKIAEFFSKGNLAPSHDPVPQKAADDEGLTALQQLVDLILAEEGRSVADYNGRAQFFQSSAEVFASRSAGEAAGGGSIRYLESAQEKTEERVLQQHEDVMLKDSGRSVEDYRRREHVLGKAARR